MDALGFDAVHMPSLVQRGANFWLSCQFRLEPSELLYSVKWYKNNEEFYRLIAAAGAQEPQERRQKQYFAVGGVNILVSRRNLQSRKLARKPSLTETEFHCNCATLRN